MKNSFCAMPDPWKDRLCIALMIRFPTWNEKWPKIKRRSFLGFLFGLFPNVAITIFGTVNLTPRFYRKEVSQEYLFSIYAHEIYHAIDQKRTGHIKWLIKYLILFVRYGSRRGHPMELPAYQFQDTFIHVQT